MSGKDPNRPDLDLNEAVAQGTSAERSTGIRQTGHGEEGAPAPTPRDPSALIGRVIDERYRIVGQIGEGGMGTVFEAEHLKLGKKVALKIILPEFAGDGDMATRFAREAMASARLDHPHVASAMDYGSLPEGGAYLVMQLVRGRDLGDIVEEKGRLPWPEATAVALQVADALAAAHAEGVVHRDLKPDNVLIETRDDGSTLVKVLDFGIARVAVTDEPGPEGAAPQRALTRVGTVMGTPGYMAPEQAVGDKVDHRVDLYALGVILWEVLSGKHLYEGTNLTHIVTRQLTEDPPPVREAAVDTSIPWELEELIGELLAREPDKRPQAAAGVRDRLRELALRASDTSTAVPAHLTQSGTFNLPTDGPTETAAVARTMVASDGATRPRTRSSPITEVLSRLRTTAQNLGPRRLALAGAGCAVLLGLSVVLGASGFLFGNGDGAGGRAKRGVIGAFLPKPVPHEVQEHIDVLLETDSRSERRRAARWLEKHEPEDEVPEYARAIAAFESARGCRAMKRALGPVRDADDERALPALMRIHDSPERGCGFLRMSDCYGCLRQDLAETIEALGGDLR